MILQLYRTCTRTCTAVHVHVGSYSSQPARMSTGSEVQHLGQARSHASKIECSWWMVGRTGVLLLTTPSTSHHHPLLSSSSSLFFVCKTRGGGLSLGQPTLNPVRAHPRDAPTTANLRGHRLPSHYCHHHSEYSSRNDLPCRMHAIHRSYEPYRSRP